MVLLLPNKHFKDLLALSSSFLCELSECMFCAHASALSESLTPLACTRWLHAVSYVLWHIQRAAGGQRAPSACWIHYSHKLIGGLSVFGLAEQYLLPATLTEAMCQFIMGLPHTSTQCAWCDAFHERGFAGGVICLSALLSNFSRVEICKCHQWSMRRYKWIFGSEQQTDCWCWSLEAVLKPYISVFYRQLK